MPHPLNAAKQHSGNVSNWRRELLFRKYYPIEIQRPQWPDWVDSDVHNILQKVSRGPIQCRSVSVSVCELECDPEHHRSAGRGQTLLPTYTDHLQPPVYSPLPPSCLQLWPGYTLPSADGKQITRHIKGPLSVHGLTHTCTSTHRRTQDNRASAGARVARGVDSGSWGSRRGGGVWHCPTQRQPWNSPLAQWDLPLCLWDNV